MESESSIDHERLYEDEKQSGRRWLDSYPIKTSWIPYVLLALLYVLILALFITTFSGADESSKNLVTSKEINNFRIKVHNLSSNIDDLHLEVKKKTCEPGWKQFGDSCYYLTKFKASWSKIRSSCITQGTDLAVITSSSEQLFLSTFSEASISKRYWIGLHDMDEEEKWMWIDGTDYQTSYQHWKKGEPNNSRDEDCAHMWTFGEWNDAPCDYDAYGICEKKL
ncbi:hepatic lectin-like [Anomaloglossus baeobatrachus]|uniref:hepatic lectin-like n=1 Tax=Anomaloglossus baeobatrachus TaxID=238106 RepID=UPI003F4F62AF